MKRRKTREKLVGETGKIVSKKPKGAKLLVSKDTAKIWPVFTFISKLYQCRHIYRFCVNKRFLVKCSRTSLLNLLWFHPVSFLRRDRRIPSLVFFDVEIANSELQNWVFTFLLINKGSIGFISGLFSCFLTLKIKVKLDQIEYFSW